MPQAPLAPHHSFRISLCLMLSGCLALVGQAGDWQELTADQWRHYNAKPDAPLAKVWQIEDGGKTLHCIAGNGSWRRADLISLEQYEDFELVVEWKVAGGSNSGVFYFVKEDPKAPIYLRALEHQILDDKGFKGGNAPPGHRAGAIFDVAAATAEKKQLKPVGDWNLTRIRAVGNTVEHWLNGHRILAIDLESPEIQAAIKKKNYVLARRGHVALQDHGCAVWFRNVRIRRLDDE